MERNLHILLDWLLPGKGGSLCSWRGHCPSGVVNDPLPGGLCPGEEPWRKHASSPDSLGVSPVGLSALWWALGLEQEPGLLSRRGQG